MPALSSHSAVAVSFQRQQTWARLFSVNYFSLPVGCSNCRPSHVVASRTSRLAESHEITGPVVSDSDQNPCRSVRLFSRIEQQGGFGPLPQSLALV